MILAGLIAARFTHYTALLLLFGAASFTLFAAPSSRNAAPGQDSPVPGGLRPILLWTSLAALVSAVGVLAMTAANLSGVLGGMVDLPTLQTIVADTDFGRVWSFRLAVAAALGGWFCLRPRSSASRAADWAVLLLAGALTASVALTGHAQIRTELAGGIHRAADAAHLIAAAVWLGALPPFLALLRASRTRGDDEALRAGRLLQRFHLVGLTAVATLLVSGLINSWFLVGDLRALLTTTYGRLLCVKLALFAAMVGLAADNRLRLVPRLNEALAGGLPAEAWLRRLRRHVASEFILGLGVLLTVAVLGAIAPAIDA